MGSKQYEHRPHETGPEIDEGWWASILADEGELDGHKPGHQDLFAQIPSTKERNWEIIRRIHTDDEIICLYVHGYNRGGLLVSGDCIQGFVPISHLVAVPSENSETFRKTFLSKYVGRTLRLKIIECEPSQDRIVLSERAAQSGEGRRNHLFLTLSEGDVVSGTVTNITEFGVFIDLGGIEGLIHVSELSWGRVENPHKFLSVGQRIEAMVLTICKQNSRMALSIKRLHPNPWESLLSRYQPGDIVKASITSIMPFGIFVQLENNVEGLIHISSIQKVEETDLDSSLEVGQVVQVQILHMDIERRRLGLGLVTFG